MSKELEALKILKANAIMFDDGTDFGASMLEAINDLDTYLTQPSEEEVCIDKKDFVELVHGYYAFIEFAPKSNFDGSEEKFYYKMEDIAIGKGCYKGESK